MNRIVQFNARSLLGEDVLMALDWWTHNVTELEQVPPYSKGGTHKGEYLMYRNPPTAMYILEKLVSSIQPYVESTLYPAYSYVNIVYSGYSLIPHTDSNYDESTLLLTITPSIEGTSSWPIYIEVAGEVKVYETLPNGKALMFNPHMYKHWRAPFEGTRAVHLLFGMTSKEELQWSDRSGAIGEEEIITKMLTEGKGVHGFSLGVAKSFKKPHRYAPRSARGSETYDVKTFEEYKNTLSNTKPPLAGEGLGLVPSKSIRKFITPLNTLGKEFIDRLYRWLKTIGNNLELRPWFYIDSTSTPGASWSLGDPVAILVGKKLEDAVFKELGKRAYISYAGITILRKGVPLIKHIDLNRSSQYLVSWPFILQGVENLTEWPLYIEGEKYDTLSVEKAFLFDGHSKYHWRDAFEGEYCLAWYLRYTTDISIRRFGGSNEEGYAELYRIAEKELNEEPPNIQSHKALDMNWYTSSVRERVDDWIAGTRTISLPAGDNQLLDSNTLQALFEESLVGTDTMKSSILSTLKKVVEKYCAQLEPECPVALSNKYELHEYEVIHLSALSNEGSVWQKVDTKGGGVIVYIKIYELEGTKGGDLEVYGDITSKPKSRVGDVTLCPQWRCTKRITPVYYGSVSYLVATFGKNYKYNFEPIILNNVLSLQQVKAIKDLKGLHWSSGLVMGAKGEEEEIRKCKISWLYRKDDYDWLYNIVDDLPLRLGLGLDLEAQTIQYTKYGPGGHYDIHMDKGEAGSATENRVVSCSIIIQSALSGGELEVDEKERALTSGDAILFPSTTLHGVHPVIEGERLSLVIWYHEAGGEE